jgi:hypothetical protein
VLQWQLLLHHCHASNRRSRRSQPSDGWDSQVVLRREYYLPNDTPHTRIFDSSKPGLLSLSSNIYLLWQHVSWTVRMLVFVSFIEEVSTVESCWDGVELLLSPWSLKKETLQSTESPVSIYQSTQFHTSGDLDLHQRSCENLKPHYMFIVYSL